MVILGPGGKYPNHISVFSNLYTIQAWCVQWKWKGSNGTPSLAVYKLQPSSAHVGRIRRLARARLWEVRAWSEVCFPRGCLSAAVAAVCVWLVRSHPNKELFRSWARPGRQSSHLPLCFEQVLFEKSWLTHTKYCATVLSVRYATKNLTFKVPSELL